MFADMKSMVIKAWRERYALLAINCMNLESARAAVRVAEKHRAPIILNLYQGHLSHFPATTAAAGRTALLAGFDTFALGGVAVGAGRLGRVFVIVIVLFVIRGLAGALGSGGFCLFAFGDRFINEAPPASVDFNAAGGA